MPHGISTTVAIAITGLKQYAIGATIEERFQAVIRPERISEACFMTTDEDEQFRAAVGAVMLSYGAGTPEFKRMEIEMHAIRQFSAWLSATQAGLHSDMPNLDVPEPIRLIELWRNRERK